MSTARGCYTRWVTRKGGQRAQELPVPLGLEAAYMAGWRAAVRRERKAHRLTVWLLGRVLRKSWSKQHGPGGRP